MGKACSTNGEKRNAYRILVGKPEGKRPLERPRHRWVDNIKMDLREVGWGGMEWIYLVQDRDWWGALVNMVLRMSFQWINMSVWCMLFHIRRECYRSLRL
jgi:hypothetical protein